MTTLSPSAEPTNSGPYTARAAPRDPALDGLRGVAILLVFLFHYGGGLHAHNPAVRALGYLTQAGWIGVSLFFALSGFLITGILLKKLSLKHASHSVIEPGLPEKTGADSLTSDRQSLRLRPQATSRTCNLRSFYARRAARILPLYLAALLACAVAALATGSSFAQLKPILVYAAFLQNIPPFASLALRTPPPLPLFHLWSLAVEEQFYLIWPLVLLCARTPRRAFQLCIAIFLGSFVFRAVLFAPGWFPWKIAASFATSLPTQAGALALGSALALFPTSRNLPATRFTTASNPREPATGYGQPLLKQGGNSGTTKLLVTGGAQAGLPSRAVLLAAGLLALLLLTSAALHTRSLLLNSRTAFIVLLPGASLLSATLVAFSLTPGLIRSSLSARPLAALGRISYGFYVFHILLEPLFDHLGASLTHTHAGFPYQIARLLTAFPITVLAAWLSYHLLERPFLARGAPGCSVDALAYNSRPAR